MYKPVFFNILYHFHCNVCIGFPVKKYVLIKNVYKNFSPKNEYTYSYYWLPYIFLIRSDLRICFLIKKIFRLCSWHLSSWQYSIHWRYQVSIKPGICKLEIRLFSDNLTCHGNQGLCQMFLRLKGCQPHLKTKPVSKVKTL